MHSNEDDMMIDTIARRIIRNLDGMEHEQKVSYMRKFVERLPQLTISALFFAVEMMPNVEGSTNEQH